MKKVTPFISFDGQAEEAARFYVSLLPNSQIDRITRSPMDTPGGAAGTVLLVEFTLAGNPFIALNTPGFSFTEAVSFTVQCKTQAEVDHFWDALGAGGEHGPCGWLKDKFGLSWQVNPTVLSEMLSDPDKKKANRVMEAMLKMKKIDIDKLKKAYAG